MRQLLFFIAVVVLYSFVAVHGVSAANIILTPVSDRSAQDEDMNGTFDTLFPETDSSLSSSKEAPPDPPMLGHHGEHRTAMEFDISVIPSGWTIVSANLMLPRSAFGHSPVGSTPGTIIHGYAGDGAVAVSDMLVNNFLIDIVGGIDADVQSYVQGLVNNGDAYAGFTVRSPAGFYQEFRSSESGAGPELTIEYIPEPASFVMLIFGTLAVTRRRALK
jgi:hypothetical protein